MGLIETIRRWVDGEEGDDALSRAAMEQARPRRQAEEFIVKIARAIGEVMQSEAVPMPPDSIVIPPEYIVFLSDEDDREWQGAKRRALEQGLYHVLAEHARELAGKTKLATTTFSVELRVDGTLEKGEIRAQHSWEESSSSTKTSITPRTQRQQAEQAIRQLQQQQTPINQTSAQAPPQRSPQPSIEDLDQTAAQISPYPAQVAPGNYGQNLPPIQHAADEPTRVTPKTARTDGADADATQVKKRELYRLEVWRNNQRQMVVPVFQPQVTIGRKSQKIASDVQLEGDPEVSRPHAILTRDSGGNYWLTHKGKNPTIVNGREVPVGQPFPVKPGETIAICSFLLRIQP